MKYKSEDMERLESNVANILLNYKKDRLFKNEEIVGKLKEIGFPYVKTKHYQIVWKMLQDWVSRGLLVIPPKTTNSKWTKYKVVNIDEMHRELHSMINPAHINSEIRYIDPSIIEVEAKPEPEPEEVEEEVVAEPEEEARYYQCMLETMEFISSAPRNEFTAEEIHSELCSDGLDVTLREVRINVASLAKENIIKISGKGFDVYKLVRHDLFYKRLYEQVTNQIKTLSSPPTRVVTNIELGDIYIDYVLDARARIAVLKVELKDTKDELTLYKEEVLSLESQILKLKGETV